MTNWGAWRCPGMPFSIIMTSSSSVPCGRGCLTELAQAEIGVGKRVAIRTVAAQAIGAVEASAIFYVGSGVAMLREENARGET